MSSRRSRLLSASRPNTLPPSTIRKSRSSISATPCRGTCRKIRPSPSTAAMTSTAFRSACRASAAASTTSACSRSVRPAKACAVPSGRGRARRRGNTPLIRARGEAAPPKNLKIPAMTVKKVREGNPMAYETIKYEVADQILTITLSRPEQLNAFNATMQRELIDAFDRADKDDDVRAIIVTGAGRAFCAGADLSSGADTFDRDARRGPVRRLAGGKVDYSDPQVRDGGGQVTLRIFKCLKPVIAAVNGPAVGIGVTMQLAMDIRIASEAARFGF